MPVNGYVYFGEVDRMGGHPAAGLLADRRHTRRHSEREVPRGPDNDIQHLTLVGGTLYFSTVDGPRAEREHVALAKRRDDGRHGPRDHAAVEPAG